MFNEIEADSLKFCLKPDSYNNSLIIGRKTTTNEISIAKKDDFYMDIFSEINFGGGISKAISIIGTLSTTGILPFQISGVSTTVGSPNIYSSWILLSQIEVGDTVTIGNETKTVITKVDPTPTIAGYLIADSNFTTNNSDASMTVNPKIFRVDDSSESTKFIISNNGKVGIGTAKPSARLTIKGESPIKSLAVHIGYSSHKKYCFNDSIDPAFSRIKAGDQITIKGKKTTVKETFINFLKLNDVFGPTYTTMEIKTEENINTPFFSLEDYDGNAKLLISSDGILTATEFKGKLDASNIIGLGHPHDLSSYAKTSDLEVYATHVGNTKGNPHGTRATDVGALPDTGGMVNGDLNVTGKVTATSFEGLLPTHAHSVNDITPSTNPEALTVNGIVTATSFVGLLPTHAHSANQITTGTISGVLTVNDKVGIGTTDMQYGWLTIAHDSVPLVLRETDQALDMGGLWRMVHDGGKLRFDVYKPDSPIDFQWVLVMSNSRDVTLAANLTVENNAYKPGGGTWTSKSDLRYKKNVEPLTGALDLLLKLHGVYFEYREPEKNGNLTGKQMGLIAQEVEEVFPEWVGKNDDGYKTLSIRGFEALAIESFRDIHSVYENLKIKIKELENKINILEKNIK